MTKSISLNMNNNKYSNNKTLRNQIKRNYTLMNKIGVGSFGKVYRAIEDNTNNAYAIKYCRSIFYNKEICKSYLREILFGRLLNHPCIMKTEEIIKPKSLDDFDSLWFVQELMDMDLRSFINYFQYSIEDIQCIMKQILLGLKYLHDAGVVHRDLKPDNIFINNDLSVKIGDFGLSCLYNTSTELKEYSGTIFYSAPEMSLNDTYDNKVDIWSVGCILGELITKEVLFPASDIASQIELINNTVGDKNATTFFNDLKAEYDNDAIDLLSHLLAVNPNERYSVEEALNHPFIRDVEVDIDKNEISYNNKIDFGFDENELSIEELRNIIVNEILYYH